MSEDVLDRKLQRFMFDLNNFDDDHVEEEEYEEPPPPTFSEQELEAAKQAAYQEGLQKGRNDATQESTASREQFVAEQLQVIAQSLPQIFDQEKHREAQYEAESVRLNLHLFEKLFPYLHEIYGEDSLKNAVTGILEKQSGQKSILISVHPDARDGVENHLETLSSRGLAMNISVEADENMNAGACQMSWADGGAVKNPQALANEIFEFIKDALAAHDTNGHDNTVEERGELTSDNSTAPENNIDENIEDSGVQETPQDDLNVHHETEELNEPKEEQLETPEEKPDE